MELYNNWWEEKRSAYLYSALAIYEKNQAHQKLFLELQASAEKQAGLWEEKIKKTYPDMRLSFLPDYRSSFVAYLIKWLGAKKLHFILSAMKIRGMSVFTQYHSEHKHTSLSSASNLRAAVFGINDGLISNMSLILGIAGAHANESFIVLTGIAGLLAGAASMGAGEYVSVRSQREVLEYQIAIEKQELEEYPEEEAEELSFIYQARGVPKEQADKLSQLMIQNPETGLNTLAREELGLNPEELVSPVGAMLSSFFSFALGAIIPLIPFVLFHGKFNLLISIGLTSFSLFFIGGILSLFTNRHPLFSGLRMLSIGIFAGGATFLLGKLLGATIS